MVYAETILGVEVPDDNRYQPTEKEFTEEKIQLPDLPKVDNLIPFDVSESFGFEFFIDTASLSIGKKDETFRYTVVLVSQQGAQTLYYESMRCATREVKKHAEFFGDFQKAGSRWLTAVKSDWQNIGSRGRNNYRFALYYDYWCNVGAPMFSVKDMIRAIKRGGYGPSDTMYDKT
jgi:hypothetical protein